MLPLLLTLSPNAAVLILTLGLLLITLELNRPGSILPGAFGLLLCLLSVASLLSHHMSAGAALGMASCVGLIHIEARSPSGKIQLLIVVTTIPLIFCMGTLVPLLPGPEISTPVAISCGFVLAAGTTLLTRIARRARLNKGLD